MSRFGLARRLSKLGVCSRTEAARLIVAGRVAVDGKRCTDPEFPTHAGVRLQVDGRDVVAPAYRYLALNKPRGLLTTASDEQGRDTIYSCLPTDAWLAPVGRLDKASEGLLLLTNDTGWSAWIASPASGVRKTYHVKIDRAPDSAMVESLREGLTVDGETLAAVDVSILRAEARSGWLQFVLDEGRNRHIRRMLAALDIGVLRLVRVAIGGLLLGDLAKGQWRELTLAELAACGLAVNPDAPIVGNAKGTPSAAPRRAPVAH